jgi:hypothetical protein
MNVGNSWTDTILSPIVKLDTYYLFEYFNKHSKIKDYFKGRVVVGRGG